MFFYFVQVRQQAPQQQAYVAPSVRQYQQAQQAQVS